MQYNNIPFKISYFNKSIFCFLLASCGPDLDSFREPHSSTCLYSTYIFILPNLNKVKECLTFFIENNNT